MLGMQSLLARIGVLLSLMFSVHGAFAQECGSRLLVSGYYSNVHIYDACTGAYLRKLDESGRIQGAQAVKIGPDGKLWVVSEMAGTILRYRADTFEFIDTFATVGADWGVTGLTFVGADSVYLSSYSTSALRQYSVATGAAQGSLPLAGVSLLKGPDNGMMTGPDGQIYVPGYDTSNIVRFDPVGKTYAAFVAARADGLRRTRGLLLSPDGTKLYVTGEGSGQVLRYRFPGGGLDKVITSSLVQPTGLAWHPDGSLLVAAQGSIGNGVLKLDPETGAERSLLVSNGSGGLSGPTYVAIIPAASTGSTPDPATIGSQYWLTALGTLSGTTLNMPDAYTALGTSFGSDFNPAELRVPRWGSLRLNFLSCTEAEFSWQSTGTNTANFGNGGYRVIRSLTHPAVVDCQRTGIAGAPNSQWLSGSWYGGASRNGEGLMLETDGNGLVFATWFTYRPRTATP